MHLHSLNSKGILIWIMLWVKRPSPQDASRRPLPLLVIYSSRKSQVLRTIHFLSYSTPTLFFSQVTASFVSNWLLQMFSHFLRSLSNVVAQRVSICCSLTSHKNCIELFLLQCTMWFVPPESFFVAVVCDFVTDFFLVTMGCCNWIFFLLQALLSFVATGYFFCCKIY